MYRLLILAFSMFLVFSCTQTNSKRDHDSLKDSVLKEYVTYIDTLSHQDDRFPYFDSTESNYKIMEAYYHNDSTYLKELREHIQRSKQQNLLDLSSINKKEPNLKRIDADEAYQFDFGETFCDFYYNLTISKKYDSINLHSMTYQLKKGKDDSIKSDLVKEFDKKISQSNWIHFLNIITYADFWGLKSYKEENGFDGSSLRVNGIIRNHFDFKIIKAHSIQRRFIHNSAIYDVFKFLLQLADIKNECIH